jgi:hypothetical protein
VLGQEGGACSDEKLGGINNHQLHTSTRLTFISNINNMVGIKAEIVVVAVLPYVN